MGGRHTRMLWRSARALGGQHRGRDIPSPRGESPARRRSAAVPEKRAVPRPAAPPGRRRRNPRLKRGVMKAFQFVEWQKTGELREVPVPEPGPGQVLVKIGGAGACHSDLHILEMEKPTGAGKFKLPLTLGHENAGWVEKLGPGAKGFAKNDPVIVYGPWGCGLCMNCRLGMENYCEQPGGPTPGGLN